MNTNTSYELLKEQNELERKSGFNVVLLLFNYIFLNIYLNHYLPALINFLLLIIITAILSFNKTKNKSLVTVFFILTSLHIFNSSARCGLESGVYLYYIVIVSYLFFLFNFKEDKIKIILVLTFITIELLLLFSTNFSITKPDYLTPENRKLMFKISIFGVFESICFLVYFIQKRQELLFKYYHENEILNKEINKYSNKNDLTITKLDELIDTAIKNNKEFYIKFESYYPFFCEQLLKKSSELVLSELEIIAYTKLGFTTKEIAIYTNSTVRAIESKKYRIRKKLNIPTNVDLGIWIKNF